MGFDLSSVAIKIVAHQFAVDGRNLAAGQGSPGCFDPRGPVAGGPGVSGLVLRRAALNPSGGDARTRKGIVGR